MKTVGVVVVSILAVLILLPIIKFVLGLLFGLASLAMGLLYFALLVVAVIVIVGFVRRMMRV